MTQAIDALWDRRRSVVALCVAITLVTTAVACTSSQVSAQPRAYSKCLQPAAMSRGWGEPNYVEDFNNPAALINWYVYDSAGHAGNGRRTPSAVSVADGVLTITGDAQGNSGGMSWKTSQKYGRWEICIKSSPAAAAYHSVALLWPDAEDWPIGGEIDFMEIVDPARQKVEAFLHYGADDQRLGGNVDMDATQWHAWAVEWTPDHIVTYVDGVPWWEATDTGHFPPRSMHLCIQLDDFGGDVRAGGQQTVDWVRQYPYR
jgi:hypothetical protein